MTSPAVTREIAQRVLDEYGGDGDGETEQCPATAEALRVFGLLNLSPAPSAAGAAGSDSDPKRAFRSMRNLDCIYRAAADPPVTPAPAVYVGNVAAATTRAMLAEHGITAIVNCTNDLPTKFAKAPFKDPSIRYLRFDAMSCGRFAVGSGRRGGDAGVSAPMAVAEAFAEPLDFIDAALSEGRSVLIHCMLGAHRAGSVGTAFVMRKARLRRDGAIAACRRCRGVVDPLKYDELGTMLSLFERHLEINGAYYSQEAGAGRKTSTGSILGALYDTSD